jgi:hypothetical protein
LKPKNLLGLFLISTTMFYCSKKQYICPAYNTYFIHDSKERDKVFMPFKVDSMGSSANEIHTNATDSDADTSVQNFDPKSGENSKFQPKVNDVKGGKKYQINGLVSANKSGKYKLRNVSDIEMKVIAIKGTTLFSGVDSTSKMPVRDSLSTEPVEADTTK